MPKAGSEDQTRLIFHLSYDCKRDGEKSLNYHTPRNKCTISYKDLDHAIQAYWQVYEAAAFDSTHKKLNTHENPQLKLREKWKSKFFKDQKCNRVIYAGKSNLKSVFRILGLSPKSWPWLVMKAQDPQTGQWKYFVDKCLPFGASISCALFQWFCNALAI